MKKLYLFIICLFLVGSINVFADDNNNLEITYVSDDIIISSIDSNASISLSCLAQGDNLTYQWYENTFDNNTWRIPSNNLYTGSDSPTLVRSNLSSLIEASTPVRFKCVVKSGEIVKESRIITVYFDGSLRISNNASESNVLYNYLGVFFVTFIGYIKDIGNIIVNTPILLITVGFLVLGGSIGIFGRLLSRN